jgi:hypothetical protein
MAPGTLKPREHLSGDSISDVMDELRWHRGNKDGVLLDSEACRILVDGWDELTSPKGKPGRPGGFVASIFDAFDIEAERKRLAGTGMNPVTDAAVANEICKKWGTQKVSAIKRIRRTDRAFRK